MELNWTAGAIGAIAGGIIGFVYKYRQIQRERREAQSFLTDIVSVSPHWTGVMAVYAQAEEDGEDISFAEARRRAKSKWEPLDVYRSFDEAAERVRDMERDADAFASQIENQIEKMN